MAELALAIVPIFLSACQGFVVLQEKFDVFRHYKKEIKWLRRKVDIQAKCFKCEMHHLVINTLEDKHKAQSMIDNHENWKDPDLESAFEQYMGREYDNFLLAARDVHEALVNIEAKLAVFAPPDVKSPLFRATRDKFRLAFKKDQYQEDIDTLKESICELKRVRKQAAAVAKTSIKREKQLDRERRDTLAHLAAIDLAVHHDTVRQYRFVRSLSSSFQAYLREQWTCCNPSHSHHKGTLFLTCASERRPSVVWLLESSGAHGYTTRLSNRLLFNIVRQPPPGLPTPDSETKSFDGLERSPKRQRLSPPPFVTRDRLASSHHALVSVDDPLPSLCKQLEEASLDPRAQKHPLIRNDVQHQEHYRFEPQQVHSIILSSSKTPKSSNIFSTISTWDLHETKSRPLSQLLCVKPHHVMLDRERIKLAAGLVRATLMAHSTPGWLGLRDSQQLPPGCLLDQINFLSRGSAEISAGIDDIDSLLDTLNMPIAVGGYSKTLTSSHSDTDMTDAADLNTTAAHTQNKSADHSSNPISTEEDLKDTYGIRNLVLYRLGVALLSIALWKRIPWQDIASVRKKARALDWGGREYQCAVNKLINGDFGLGTGELDLEDECVQIEIVKNIIGPLDTTIGYISRRSQDGGVLSSENLKGLQAQSGERWLIDEPERWVGSVQPPPPYSGPGPSTWIGSPRGIDSSGHGGYFVQSP